MTANPVDLAQVDSAVKSIGEKPPATTTERIDVYFFFSFDLVGSTALKAKPLDKFTWVDLIRNFYGVCATLVREHGIPDARVWKYIGDEVVFYHRLRSPKEIEQCVEAVCRALHSFDETLGQSPVFGEAVNVVSIKACAWMAPITSNSPSNKLTAETIAKQAELRGRFIGDDVQIPIDDMAQNGAIDFLGPNIDAGFRIAKYTKRKQLVVSPSIAYYLAQKKQNKDRLKIVAYERLKGVARDKLFPIIWYHNNLGEIKSDFTYDERYGDDLIKSVCATNWWHIDELEKAFDEIHELGYFFDPKVIDGLIELHNRSDVAAPVSAKAGAPRILPEAQRPVVVGAPRHRGRARRDT